MAQWQEKFSSDFYFTVGQAYKYLKVIHRRI
jgi:hypothetical protein